jgi:hypothetical protein
MGYLSWTLTVLILGHDPPNSPVESRTFIAAPLIASFIMVAWDLAMEPVWSTVLRAPGHGLLGDPTLEFRCLTFGLVFDRIHIFSALRALPRQRFRNNETFAPQLLASCHSLLRSFSVGESASAASAPRLQRSFRSVRSVMAGREHYRGNSSRLHIGHGSVRLCGVGSAVESRNKITRENANGGWG